MAVVRLSSANADGLTGVCRGDTVELRLPACPAAELGWRWLLPEALRLVADRPGTAGGRTLTFAVTASGLHEFRVELARPWEGEAAQAFTFVLHAP
ncbi:protease inhibitor I42 family protein [Actinokineospora bangkokensis]|uniref:Proteinase inhibitor I42 chagasin domain-containing protein n=1 Tax=Actinokineospora bangkokensis TaxID=1193682 RepID=A0A1Q9LE37_9PSEU|nr:protease inhibitor I42 family protein [Actinokineospora bangkokensis]OLR90272.1 hypothetical protein BJP25_02140 [Actinokineospora bangkokensis]